VPRAAAAQEHEVRQEHLVAEQVDVTVGVHVRGPHGQAGDGADEQHRAGEAAGAVAEDHPHAGARLRQEVEVAVAVDIRQRQRPVGGGDEPGDADAAGADQGAGPVAAIEPDRVVGGVVDGDVEIPVTVEVAQGQRVGLRPGGESRVAAVRDAVLHWPELPRAGTEHHAQRVPRLVAEFPASQQDEVHVAVDVQVDRQGRRKLVGDGHVGRRAEPAGSVAQAHAQRVEAAPRDIEHAVLVEVGRREVAAERDGAGDRRPEAAGSVGEPGHDRARELLQPEQVVEAVAVEVGHTRPQDRCRLRHEQRLAQAALPVPRHEQDAGLLLDGDVVVAVVVEVRHGRADRGRGGHVLLDGLVGAAARAHQQGQAGGIVRGDHEVGPAVAVQLGDLERLRPLRQRERRARQQRAGAIAEQQVHRRRRVHADGDVELAVAVEVGDRQARSPTRPCRP
jgi:hypothetical protein